MILVDTAVGSHELRSLIQRQGISCDATPIKYADATFEGYGPQGRVGVGIERKKVREFLDCIKTGRYTGHQRVGMAKMYPRFCILMVEGLWKPDRQSGLLLQGIENPDGRVFWTPKWGQGMDKVMYYTFRRYLFSVMLSGVYVLFTREITHTAYEITELYHYFQKQWREHTALLQMHNDFLSLPTLDRAPSVVRKWAFALDGIGTQYSEDAERVFKTPVALANSQELDWMKIPGVGVDTALNVIRQIEGRR